LTSSAHHALTIDVIFGGLYPSVDLAVTIQCGRVPLIEIGLYVVESLGLCDRRSKTLCPELREEDEGYEDRQPKDRHLCRAGEGLKAI